MEDDHLNIHQFLANRMRGRKQKDLAIRLGVTPSLISKIKTEQIPSNRLIRDLSKILGWYPEQEERAIKLASIAREKAKEKREEIKNNPTITPTPATHYLQPRLLREVQKLKQLFVEVSQSQARI